MSFTHTCCNTPAVKAEYAAKGVKGAIGDMECYFAGNKESKRAIIVTYDIFGYHANVIQLCDILGSQGFYVVLPDFLRGKPLTEADLGKPGVFAKFAANEGSWAANKAAHKAVYDFLKAEGVTSVGVIGFCWGAHLAVSAASDMDREFGGVAIVHPSMIAEGDLGKVQAPLLALPSKDEPDYSKDFESLKDKAFFDKCYMERFNDMFHGFCGARGDWSKPEQARRANDAIKLISKFFNNVL
ncbi:hypothetical protein LPJ66_009103 [Kickxella alabastrina]|uniref:Uncharacterized protein n=1 Tax=Kickxella alabastrina TaxID=61397 RepID=A0ACC1I473_9FUNG|nr:hypothetical protein LPJ66_009103 [Kickxella alabastrina]